MLMFFAAVFQKSCWKEMQQRTRFATPPLAPVHRRVRHGKARGQARDLIRVLLSNNTTH